MRTKQIRLLTVTTMLMLSMRACNAGSTAQPIETTAPGGKVIGVAA